MHIIKAFLFKIFHLTHTNKNNMLLPINEMIQHNLKFCVSVLESSFGSIKLKLKMFAHKHMYKDPLGRTHTNLKLLHFAKVRLISDDNTMPFHLLAGLKCMKMPCVKSHFFILLSSQTKHLRADKSFNDQPLLFSTTEKKHLLESRGHKSQTNFTSNTNHLEIFQPPSRKRCACRTAERVLSEHTWPILRAPCKRF